MLNPLKSFFGIEELPSNTQQLLMKFFFLFGIFMLLFNLFNTFIFLEYIDKFGYELTGVILAVGFLAQLLTDYPTGSLSDYIGQRYVVALSLIFASVGCLLISLYNDFNVFLLASVCFGISMGQLSGSFQTYLDNNYKKSTGKTIDPERKIYSFAFQRMGTIFSTIMACSFFIGGLLSTLISRKFVFLITSFCMFFYIPIIILFLKDLTPDKNIDNATSILPPKRHNYFHYFISGIKFVFSSRKSFFMILGLSFIYLVEGLWFTLILFPFYFSYTGNDAGVGLIRGLIFVSGAFLQIYSAKYTKRMDTKNLAKFSTVYYVLFYICAIGILFWIPPHGTFNIVGIILVLLLMLFIVNGLGVLVFTLFQRTMMIEIPSESRNSVYSLLPSIALLLQIPFLPIFGSIIESGGLIAGIEVLLGISSIGCFFLFLFHYFSGNSELTIPLAPIETTPVAD